MWNQTRTQAESSNLRKQAGQAERNEVERTSNQPR